MEQPAPIRPRTTRSDVVQAFEVLSCHTTKERFTIGEGGWSAGQLSAVTQCSYSRVATEVRPV
ncbi:unnamed protein product [Periconia digitata]|uniref:Uncharacterized protein n=1 Tax=Periconia digitata TaxID=1303443 RepID=A0A9W4UJA8_9PLEO|nr:unnamed protein product [Periconia digitata]